MRCCVLCIFILMGHSFGQMMVKNNSNQVIMRITNSGKVAIGIDVDEPTETLEVDGKTRTQDLQILSSAFEGAVLTSIDANGNAEWQTAPSTFVDFSENLTVGIDWNDPGLTFADDQYVVYFIAVEGTGFDGSLYKYLNATMTLRANVSKSSQIRYLKGATHDKVYTLASCLAIDDNVDTNTYSRVPVHYNVSEGKYGFYVSTSGSGRVIWRIHGGILK